MSAVVRTSHPERTVETLAPLIPLPTSRARLESAAQAACRRVAPLWPLKHFVAVNPFLGFTDRSFHAACTTMRRVARIDMLMPRAFYRDAMARGEITEADLEQALQRASAAWRVPGSVEELRAGMHRDVPIRTGRNAVVATVAEVLDTLAQGDRQASRTAFMIDEISRWCAAYFDEGQSVWRLPTRALRPYAAWRESVRNDLNPEMMGIRDFRAAVTRLPADPIDAIGAVIAELGVPDRAIEDYLQQALSDIGGWAAYARYLVWDSELHGRRDDTLLQLLAIRVVWGYTLFLQHTGTRFRAAWAQAMAKAASPPQDEQLGDDPELTIDFLLQEAYEGAYQRRLLSQLAENVVSIQARSPLRRRRLVQAAFCIDVRSEVYRRAFESVSTDAETLGFAGFFGYPIEYVKIGHEHGGAQCPVLLTPAFVVCEGVRGASETQEREILDLRLLRRRAAKAWKSFKLAAVSSFMYVETAGLLYFGKILSDTLGLTRTVKDPNTDGLDRDVLGRVGPRIETRNVGGRQTGFDDEQAVRQAEAVLRGMSLTADFARIVLLVGHGSTSANNPHASGLDCGACGGHTGEANARVAALILNEAKVRDGLRRRGIDIPPDTWFLGALHDTTTDEVTLFETDAVPASHAAELERVRARLARASSMARLERAASLGIPARPSAESRVLARSRDWSQVRPEWGLAGNAAFIAAPRSRTRGIDLGGRAFLHDYDWRKDANFAVLELIMTAPMVVASWINLQYYGSAVNNRVFGAGNKVLHNVAGTIGVLEGNAGDLKVGLPWQSVHDGDRLVHEPVRLHVVIEAPIEAINAVIARHATVRELVDHRWVHLFAMDADGLVTHRYEGLQRWGAVGA
ncbi:MAG TPA: DUF2309 domain-containing protein [Burkholderiaceae bacterium]|nr:DUF2309 domain-containing protein [Burkholderiaceae bacterium]